jgi:hypothetical protein
MDFRDPRVSRALPAFSNPMGNLNSTRPSEFLSRKPIMASPFLGHRDSMMSVPTPMSDTSSTAPTVISTGSTEGRNPKRPSDSSPSRSQPTNRRKNAKVSRACDYCKSKKLRCSGTAPCDLCVKKAFDCHYDALYRRGRPPTPPVAAPQTSKPTTFQSSSDSTKK